MGAIGLNPIRIDRIGFDPIRVNAIRLGVPGAASGSGRPYIEPEVLASLKAVCICYGKSNDDPDRAIVKNLVDTDNPFVISNAAFKLNSGFGKYETELSDTKIWTQSKETTSTAFSSSYNGLSGWIIFANTELTNSADMPSFKIQVKGLLEGQELIYRYYDSAGQSNVYSMAKDGEYTLPADIRTAKPLVSNTSGLQVVKNENNIITITQIPQFEGAFVTDGVDDLITSTKTLGQMVGESGDYTIISMIHQLSNSHATTGDYGFALTNYIRSEDGYTRSRVTNIGKTAIYGYYANPKNSDAPAYNNILGDKADLLSETNAMPKIYNDKINIQGFIRHDGVIGELSKLAWYWTVVAKGQLTTDQINQVIAYFNLDRCVEPTVLYDIKRQGLSNDTPAADWYLKDFSKNRFNMSLFNFAKKGGSGVSAKQGESIKDYSIIKDEEYQELTIYNEFKYKIKSKLSNRYWTVQYINKSNTSYPTTIVTDKDAFWINSATYYDADNNKQVIRKEIDVPANTPTSVLCCGYDQFDIPEDATSIVSAVSYINYNAAGEITVEFIPSFKGALITDGVNDYGKVTGLPIFKDYTVIADYIRMNKDVENGGIACVVSKSNVSNNGAFISNHWNSIGTINHCYSFGQDNMVAVDDSERKIYYQSKYSNQGVSITSGNGVDGEYMWLGTIRDNDSRFFTGAIYSLMTFPYSLSEFLIERQLKKRKAGTLYPDMIELRPIIKGGSIFKYLRVSDNKTLYPGDYINVGDTIRFYVSDISGTPNEVSKFTVNGIEGTPKGNNGDLFDVVVTKSPQKIGITIYQPPQYLTMLSNSTLISNETLIKNE